MADPAAIDLQAIENLRALNPDDGDEFVREIAGIYLEDTPQRIVELEQSRTAGDIPKFTRAAHSIKGSSSNVGASQVRATAELLEHQSRTEGLANLDSLIAQLKGDFVRAESELHRIMGK